MSVSTNLKLEFTPRALEDIDPEHPGRNPQPLATFWHNSAVTAVAFSPDGKYVLTVAERKTILWEPGKDIMDFLKQRLPN